MTKHQTNPKVDAFLSRATKWQQEMEKLRAILLDCPLEEDLKWGKPCYSFQESNQVIIIGFKEYCALLFCKGALLKDPRRILVTAGENTQAARQARFKSLKEINDLAPTLHTYILEAIEAVKAGLKVEYRKSTELVFPEEFQRKLEADEQLQTAFLALTPGRRRAYHIYFTGAKQAKTREARVEKCLPQILQGKGLNDD